MTNITDGELQLHFLHSVFMRARNSAGAGQTDDHEHRWTSTMGPTSMCMSTIKAFAAVVGIGHLAPVGEPTPGDSVASFEQDFRRLELFLAISGTDFR